MSKPRGILGAKWEGGGCCRGGGGGREVGVGGEGERSTEGEAVTVTSSPLGGWGGRVGGIGLYHSVVGAHGFLVADAHGVFPATGPVLLLP